MVHQPAALEAMEVAKANGATLEGHVSQPLTPEIARHADHLLAMTHGHLEIVHALYPQLGCQPRLLSPTGEDICDPIGGDRAVYEACAGQIRSSPEAFIAEVVREPT
jgi:protein-tyrosine-phosphatase